MITLISSTLAALFSFAWLEYLFCCIDDCRNDAAHGDLDFKRLLPFDGIARLIMLESVEGMFCGGIESDDFNL